MAAEGSGPGDMADRGAAGVDVRRSVAIGLTIEVHEVSASRSSFEPVFERMLDVEHFVRTGKHRVTIRIEPVAREEEAYVIVAQTFPANVLRNGDGSEGPADTRDAGV